MKKVLVVGLGLIGGSIALSIRRAHSHYIIGCDLNHEDGQLALKLGVIDEFVMDVTECAHEMDFIILASPIFSICNYLTRLQDLELKQSVIITDVGSTKVQICEVARPLSEKGITFIGGHPMAGSHKSGIVGAKAHLFENALYVLTPDVDDHPKVEMLKELLIGTQATFVIIDPEEHDKLTGMVSHFPHVIAAGIVRQAERFSNNHPLTSRMAAGGFRDITRIASSNPKVWEDIVRSNKNNVLACLDNWMEEMNHVRGLIENNHIEEIYEFFETAREFRDAMPARGSGAIPSFYDLYVDIVDRPGAIAHVTGLIEAMNISIKNIHIIEAREEIFGVLRLSFQTDQDRLKAKEVLLKAKYESNITL